MHHSPRLSGLFWNTGRSDRSRLVAEVAAERELDIIVLAESGTDLNDLLKALTERTGVPYHCPSRLTQRFQVFARSADLNLDEFYGTVGGRLAVRRLHWNGEEILFMTAHLVDKHNWPEGDQHSEAQVLAGQIRAEEEKADHRRTILVGDLNMNPFERGVVQAAGLHAMMTKADISAGSRIVQTQEYPFFYNPMWGLFGDRTPGPPGTFYRRNPLQLSYDWNILDHFLIRPQLLERYAEEVEIVSRIGEVSLLSQTGRPDANVGSDHLPLFFRLTSIASTKT